MVKPFWVPRGSQQIALLMSVVLIHLGCAAHDALRVMSLDGLALYFLERPEFQLDGCRSSRRHSALLLEFRNRKVSRRVIKLLRCPWGETVLQLLLREGAAAAPVKGSRGRKARHRVVARQIWTPIAAEGEHNVRAKLPHPLHQPRGHLGEVGLDQRPVRILP